MSAAVQNQKRYYYLNQQFTRGIVRRYLVTLQYDIIIGLDFGHGESVMYKYYKEEDGEWNTKRLRLNDADDPAIPTYISYDSGLPVIGKDVDNDDGFMQYFKVEPAYWDKDVTSKVKFRKAIEDYISLLWKNALKYDTELADEVRKNKVLIAVGCPASEAWTSEDAIEDYSLLVFSATGCPFVTILPESTAAIMTPILTGDPDLSSGVAIYDFGSSTIDFTYVVMGKVMITRSIRLGGSDIDKAMLTKILQDNHLTMQAVPANERSRIYAQLRRNKEDFYIKGCKPLNKQLICLPGRDVDYIVDQAFMDDVLWKINVKTGDPEYSGLSWGEAFRKFLAETGNISRTNRGSRNVVLTGGTSFVSFVYDMTKKEYPFSDVSQDPDPSSSVAKGLCYAKGLEVKALGELDDVDETIKKAAEEAYDALLGDFSTCLCGYVWDISSQAADALLSDGKEHMLSEISAEISKAVKNDPQLIPKCEQELKKLFREKGKLCHKPIREQVNQLSQKLYRAKITSVPQISSADAAIPDSILADCDIPGLVSSLGIGTIGLMAFCEFLVGILMFVLVLTIIGIPIASILSDADDWLHEKVQQYIEKHDMVMSPSRCKKFADSFKSKRDRKTNIEKTAIKLKKKLLKDEKMRNAFMQMIDEQYEIALGKIMFLVFDQKGN